MMPRLGSVTVAGSVRLPYVEQGATDGTPVVLLHGYTDSWRSFEPLLPHLPDRLHVYAFTQRGHGDADRPMDGYDAGTMAADAAAFMDALGIERPVVVGHSMGGQVALRLAIDRPGRVRALVLLGAFATLGGNRVIQELWDSTASTLEDPVDPAFVRAFQESTVAAPVPASFLDLVVLESLKVPARVWRAAFDGQVRTDLSRDLARIKAPTLAIWGDRDGICTSDVQRVLSRSIPGASVVTYADTGHAVHWEQPARIAVDLVTFVERINGVDVSASRARSAARGRGDSWGARA